MVFFSFFSTTLQKRFGLVLMIVKTKVIGCGLIDLRRHLPIGQMMHPIMADTVVQLWGRAANGTMRNAVLN